MGRAQTAAPAPRAPVSATEGDLEADPGARVAGRPPIVRTRVSLSLAPARRRGCCGSGCVGCPFGDWLRRVRALGAGQP
jgi:hypothetical protein